MRVLRVAGLLALSLVTPGAGHIAAGRVRRGFFWTIAHVGVMPLLLVAAIAAIGVETIFVVGAVAVLVYILSLLDVLSIGARLPTLRWAPAVLLVAVAIVVGIAENLFIRSHVVQAFTMVAGSMEPTLLKGEHVLADRLAYKSRDPRRGDLVVYRYPPDERRVFVHRIVAGPGDRVRLVDDRVEVNGTLLAEPYAMGRRGVCDYAYGCVPLIVPAGAYFILGDRRDASHDSRSWGFVRRDRVEARVAFIYWSWDSAAKSVRFGRIGRIS